MCAYRVASTFEERGIRPPSKDSVTVGESDLKFVHLKDGKDTNLLQYVRSGGIAFPHIMIPETLQVRAAIQPNKLGNKASVSREQIMRKPENQTEGDSQEEGHNGSVRSAVAAAIEHALWLWNAKQHASDFLHSVQTRSLLAAESWLPAPVASTIFGQVPGTASAAKADAMEAEQTEGQISMLTKTEGPIVCAAWHPHRSLIAIAHRATDAILLYDLANDMWCSNILQNAYMQGITSMAWQPNCGYSLAVGCSTGVCLWSILPAANAQSSSDGSPGLSSMQFSSWMSLLSFPPLSKDHNYPSLLDHEGKVPFHRTSTSVSALAFNPSGQWLIAGHQTHGHLTVWDVALGTATPLKRSGGSSHAATLHVSVSPNGCYAISTHANGQMRLWETEGWTSRVWSDFHANISQAVWSPDSRSVYFAVANSSEIYALALYKAPPSLEAEITVVSSFEGHATAAADNDLERIRVGGAIKSLALDPKGQRLVVGFDDDSASADISLLAVYLVNTDALFRAGGDTSALMPLGYIRGPNWGRQHQLQNELAAEAVLKSTLKSEKSSRKKRVRVGLPIPSWFDFAPNFEPGALLTVAWANGKVSFVPMLFKPTSFSK
ncbi:tricorn protease domain 2-containing protein [Martensiomyces pterosporus]|nr:tricorn protease domain 2-containing protein [Martensiomyces pterosporus]